MEDKKGAKILVECLEEEGVEYVFGIPGEQTIPIIEELRKSDIDFIVTRHEQGAAFMSDVYSRICDRTGVCLSTLGPGATNLVTGVANATLDHSSVVALTSQRETIDQHKHSHQFIDTNSVFSGITKTTDEIRRTQSIPEQIRKCFEMAERERKGCAHLEIPLDTTENRADVEPLNESSDRVLPNGVQEGNIQSVLDIVEQSENPILIAGHGVLRQGASEELSEFSETTGVPVVTTFMGKGAISARSDRSVGTIGFSTDDYAMSSVKQADLVVTIGYDYIEFHTDKWNVGKDKDIVHINSDEPEIDEDYGVEMSLIGDISRILDQLNKECQQVISDSYSKNLKSQFREKLSREYAENAQPPFTPQQVVSDVRNALDDEDILICDVGSHKYWFSRRYPTYHPNRFLVSNGFASMGIAVPGCVSASLCSDDNVVAVTGDGGFMMNMQEIETAKRLNVKPTIIVLNDKEYTAISMEQSTDYNNNYGSSFENPNFKLLAESFGISGYRAEQSDKVSETIDSAIRNDSIAVVDIPVDTEESYELDSKF